MDAEREKMKTMVDCGDAVDVSHYPQPQEWDGDYLLPNALERRINGHHAPEFCDLRNAQWVWWIGRHRKTGRLRASLSFKGAELNGEYEQLLQR
jgi:hypothetical protein